MKLPSKETIKHTIQSIMVLGVLAFGFMFLYTLVWFMIGLPQATWAFLITSIMGILSTFGLLYWIWRS